MRLLEHEAKRLLAEAGLAIPRGVVLQWPADVPAAAREVPPPAVLKVQVAAGGRGKAGGVRPVTSVEEGEALAADLFRAPIRGHPVEALLWEERVRVLREFFLAVTYDPAARRPVVLLGLEGGVDVEAAAGRNPTGVARRPFDPRRGFREYHGREVATELGLRGAEAAAVGSALARIVSAFLRWDATLVEVNPLARTDAGAFVALDARIEIDDDARFRHPDLETTYGVPPREGSGRPATAFERQAAAIDAIDHRGVAGRVIEFDGDLGLLIGGGGASLTAFDAIRRHGGRPANYCEIGGNPSVRKVEALTKLILGRPGVRRIAVIMNIVSNTRVDLVARGVIKGVLAAGADPARAIAVFRVPGSWEEEGFKILRRYGVPYADRSVSIDEAARWAAVGQGR